MNDSLIISYDNCPPDFSTLIVARKDKYDMTILNKFQGDEAFGIYHYLTGGAELKSARDIPMEHHHTIVGECSGGEKIRTSICPNCLGCILTVEEEFPRFCTWCGQAIDWER